MSWPRCDSSRTPAGVIATRYSSGLISLGMPTLIARAAHIADDRQLQQRLDHAAELGLLRAHPAVQVLALEDRDVLERDGRRDGMAAERQAVREHRLVLEERLGDPVGRDQRAHRR